jgi:hypothetical protein
MKVSKKIPIPKNAAGRQRVRFPFQLLECIGDSFYVSGYGARHSVYSSLKSYNDKVAKTPIKITIKTERIGIRVWRIE